MILLCILCLRHNENDVYHLRTCKRMVFVAQVKTVFDDLRKKQKLIASQIRQLSVSPTGQLLGRKNTKRYKFCMVGRIQYYV